LAGVVGTPALALVVSLTIVSMHRTYESQDPLLVAAWVFAFVFIFIPLGIGPLLYVAVAVLPNGSVRRSVIQYGFWFPVSVGILTTLLALLGLTETHGDAASFSILAVGIFSLAMGGGLWLLGRMTPAAAYAEPRAGRIGPPAPARPEVQVSEQNGMPR
jgi:hypothetical protein